MNSEENIVNLLKEKAGTKQKVYRITKQVFAELQEVLVDKAKDISTKISNEYFSISYKETGDFDATGNGIVYFDTTGKMVGAAATTSGISTSNYDLTTHASGIPKWTPTLDGGTFQLMNSDVDVNVLIGVYNQRISALSNQNILLEAKLASITKDFQEEKDLLLKAILDLQKKYDGIKVEDKYQEDTND